MGSSRSVPIAAAPSSNGPTPSITNFNSFKPAAGSPLNNAGSPVHAAPAPLPAPAALPEKPATQPIAHSVVAPSPPTIAQTGPLGAGTILVQVAAFTHQEDADLLVHTLKGQGYSAFVRSEPQDKLLHIQVGPFSNRKDAETTKQRLLADGYQPILK
jgi:DedD protein